MNELIAIDLDKLFTQYSGVPGWSILVPSNARLACSLHFERDELWREARKSLKFYFCRASSAVNLFHGVKASTQK